MARFRGRGCGIVARRSARSTRAQRASSWLVGVDRCERAQPRAALRLVLTEATLAPVRTRIARCGATAVRTSQREGRASSAVELDVEVPLRRDVLERIVAVVIAVWGGGGVAIDARDSGSPLLRPVPGECAGTVVTFTRDGDVARRSELADLVVAIYVGGVVRALAGGATASTADLSAIALVSG